MNCCCTFVNQKFLKKCFALAVGLWNSAHCQNLADLPSLTVFTLLSAWQGQWSAGLLFRSVSLSGDLVPFLCLYFLVLSTLGEGLKQRFSLELEKPWQDGFFILSFMLLCFDSLFPHLSLDKKKKAKFGTYTKMTAFSIMMFLKSLGASRGGNIPAGLEQVRSPGHGLLLNLWFTLQQD